MPSQKIETCGLSYKYRVNLNCDNYFSNPLLIGLILLKTGNWKQNVCYFTGYSKWKRQENVNKKGKHIIYTFYTKNKKIELVNNLIRKKENVNQKSKEP